MIVKREGKWCVTNKAKTKTLGCHATRAEAEAQLAAIESAKKKDARDHDDTDEFPSRIFLKKLYSLMRDKVTMSDFKAYVRRAAGHAGGIIGYRKKKAEKKKASDPKRADDYYGTYMAPKLAKDDPAVKYKLADLADDENGMSKAVTACRDCRFYLGGSCRLVEGTIEKNYTCDLYRGVIQSYADYASALSPIRGRRVFIDIARAFAKAKKSDEPPDWIPVLPSPGKYSHPAYGKIVVTTERNQHFIDNFKDAIYQESLPIDAEHDLPTSGAMGWIVDLRLASDGSVEAKVEWTDRGVKALAEDRFRYISPSWMDEWKDPITEKVHTDILIGAALTTRPFFKEKALASLAASEDHSKGTGFYVAAHEPPNKGALKMPDDKKAAELKTIDASELKAMTDTIATLQADNTALKTANESLSGEVKKAGERLARMENDQRLRKFTDVVDGRAGGTKWVGDRTKHLDFLMKLAESFGEDSDHVKHYVETQESAAKAIRASEGFRQYSHAEGGEPEQLAGDGTAKLKEMAEALRKNDKNLSFSEAMTQVLRTPEGKAIRDKQLINPKMTVVVEEE